MSEVQKVKDEKIIPYTCQPRAPRRCLSEVGSHFYKKAKLSVNENGEQIAEPDDKQIDLYAYVQASKASTDMAQIVARWKAGDESVINVNPRGFYGDMSIVPNSVNDYEKIGKLSDAARANFDKLPDDIRGLFDNDPSKFFTSVLENKAESLIKAYFNVKKQPEEKEVKADE